MTDIEIANNVVKENVKDIAKKGLIDLDNIELYGNYKAKVDYTKYNGKRHGKLILVTAINPTPYGEGKTTVSIGLGDALRRLDKNSLIVLREPSLGPVFGIKGGATGGGYSQVVPMEDINLHFTGDFHAITCANNLLCSAIDNHIYHGNSLNINPEKIMFNRCLDLNDRILRNVSLSNRKESFNITAASEMMSILCLSKDIEDLRNKLDNILIGYDYEDKAVYAKSLGITGSLIVLLKDTLKPNLVQTLEHNPVLIHGGPFANISLGCNSIIASDLGLKLADYVITEAGFGADLGAEKFLNITSRCLGCSPSTIVLVATIKALKYNGGVSKDNIMNKDIDSLKKGLCNLEAHIDNLSKFNIPFIVCLNKYSTDSEEEINLVREYCNSRGIPMEVSTAYIDGGEGAIKLANKVLELVNKDSKISYTYEMNDDIYTKIDKVCKNIYHANKVNYNSEAREKIDKYISLGKGNLPICIAKTQYSLSDDASKLGYPKDFSVNVIDARLYSGAGFITILLGNIMTMPGLPKVPNYEKIDYVNDKIVGLD